MDGTDGVCFYDLRIAVLILQLIEMKLLFLHTTKKMNEKSDESIENRERNWQIIVFFESKHVDLFICDLSTPWG